MGKKKQIEIARDFGSITVPTSWDEITLEQFTKIIQLNDGKDEEVSLTDIMAILTNTDRSYIYSLPSDFVHTIMAHLLFLNEPLKEEAKSEVEINGEKYIINYMEKLKFGEYTDANTVMQSNKYNYAALLAILCRKKGEVYNDDYIANILDDRIEMWNKQPITKVYPLVCFFLTLSALSGTLLKDYLTTAEQALNQSLESIEDSLTIGDGIKHPMSYVKVRWKLRKLRKCISQAS